MNRNLLLVGLANFTWGIGECMFIIFQPVYLQQMGASPVEIGAILGVSGIFMAFVQAPAGYIADRFGPRPVMISAWLLGLVATVTMAFAPSLTVFVAGMVIYSTTTYVSAPMNAYITRVRGRLSMERALTINSSLYAFGAIIGPAAGGYLGSRMGLQTVYRFSAVIFLLSAAIIFQIRDQPVERHTAAETSSAGLLSNRRYLAFLALSFLIFFSVYLPQPLTPNFLRLHGISLDVIGRLGSLGSLSNALVSLLLGGINARWGILAGSFLLSLFALFLMKGTTLGWYTLAYSFLGGSRLVRLLSLAFTRSLVRATNTGLAFGLVETMNAVAVILAPVLAGVLYNNDPGSVYKVSLILLGAAFLACLISMPNIARKTYPPQELPVSESQTEIPEP